jgi:hypothetical protein
MNVLIKAVAAAVITLSAALPAQAQVVFKNPIGWAGTGCPAGSTFVDGANTAQLQVLFDSYDAGKNSLSGLARSACSFSVPIQVPSGFQVSKLTADWEGYVQGKGQFKRKYKLIGSGIVIDPSYISWKTNNYNHPSGNNFTKRDTLIHGSVAGCGGGVYKLRINSQVRALNGNSYSAIDSADLTNRLIFRVQFQPC